MIIRPLIRYKGDLELRWLTGYYRHPQKGLRLAVQFLNHDNGATIVKELPFSMLPFLTPGLVVSRGEVQIARRTGKQSSLVLADLSISEEIEAAQLSALSHFNLNRNICGDQRILCYQASGTTILIPAIELIRFLFLHSRILTESLLLPSGLMELAVTPLPGVYRDIKIEFTDRVPRKLMTSEFVEEFAWLSIDPDGRRAWDSIGRRSREGHFLTLDPPPLRDCQLEFRGLEWNSHLLVLEILAVSGRRLPADTIQWTHPLINEKSHKKSANASSRSQGGSARANRPRRQREHVVDGIAESLKYNNQDVVLLGGKRGCFSNRAEIIKLFHPRKNSALCIDRGENGNSEGVPSHTVGSVNPNLLPLVDRLPVSVDNLGLLDGLPPVEFSILEPAALEPLGNLDLLNAVLQRVESAHQGLTVTRKLYYLKRGTAFSIRGDRRRTYLLALFTSQRCPPRVLIDVDHSNRRGLSALFLRYDAPIPLADVSIHLMLLLDALVDNYGHWDPIAEARLSKFVTITRLPKLLRMVERAEDDEYVRRWVHRLSKELHLDQMNLNDAWLIA